MRINECLFDVIYFGILTPTHTKCCNINIPFEKEAHGIRTSTSKWHLNVQSMSPTSSIINSSNSKGEITHKYYTVLKVLVWVPHFNLAQHQIIEWFAPCQIHNIIWCTHNVASWNANEFCKISKMALNLCLKCERLKNWSVEKMRSGKYAQSFKEHIAITELRAIFERCTAGSIEFASWLESHRNFHLNLWIG